MTTTIPVKIPGIPFELSWLGDPLSWETTPDGLTLTAGPNCDWFSDPNGTAQNTVIVGHTPTFETSLYRERRALH